MVIWQQRRGWLTLCERKLKEIIDFGGEEISPGDVDAILLSHPKALEAASFGRSHGTAMKLLLHETRVQWALATFLALIAGYLDGYGLLFLGTYVSFMSGNTTTTGLRGGQGNFDAALPAAIAIVFFVTGSFMGNLFTQSKLRHSHRVIFGVIAGLLAAVAGLEWHGLGNIASEIAVLSLAMGMMNPALIRIGAEAVSLTFVTGTLSRIGGHLAATAARKPLLDRQRADDCHLARARIDASL